MGKLPRLGVAHQLAPVAAPSTRQPFPGRLRSDLGLGLFQPSSKLIQQWQTFLLTAFVLLFIIEFFQIALNTVELVDQVQRDIRTPGFALGGTFVSSTNLRRPAAHSLNDRLCGQGVVVGVSDSHDIAATLISRSTKAQAVDGFSEVHRFGLEIDLFDFGIGSHHQVLAPQRDQEHSIDDQLSVLNVEFMGRLRKIGGGLPCLQINS